MNKAELLSVLKLVVAALEAYDEPKSTKHYTNLHDLRDDLVVRRQSTAETFWDLHELRDKMQAEKL
jgi:hypothetical protein